MDFNYSSDRQMSADTLEHLLQECAPIAALGRQAA